RPCFRRGLSAAILLTMTLSMTLPASAADPLASGGFAEVLISAQETDVPQSTLQLSLYQRDGGERFQAVDTLDFDTPVNRVTKDAEFHLIPQTSQVTVTVDYLTDLNGDGLYELLSSQESPVCDVLTPSGTLTAASSGVSTALTAGKTYTITASSLLKRGQAAIQDRTTSGSSSHLSGMTGGQTAADSILYMITVNYHSVHDNADYELCYYLNLFDQLPAPSAADYRDVPAGAWYYGAVDYVVSQGLLSGSSRSRFSPNQPLNRAMLAQILFQLAGKPDGGLTHFTDVPDTAWCYSAVSWAVSRDIMSGVDGETFAPERAPTRQELALTLFRYAKAAGLDTQKRAQLTSYSDAGQVAGWAQEAVEWAVGQGLLAGRSTNGTQILAPLGTVTRAEFSAVLKTLCETVLPKQ
ncbi:MAG: S-layer homology domain-containing protein, partial [Oscillospiraceae bacterium]|nr:S-layer homology domain-containing protein [Oscillospiraceae bacterium]